MIRVPFERGAVESAKHVLKGSPVAKSAFELGIRYAIRELHNQALLSKAY